MDRDGLFRKITALGLVLLLFLQLYLLFESHDAMVSSEPVIMDNGDGSMTATWNFDTPSDYFLTDTTMANGEVNLALDLFAWLQTTEMGFQAGTFMNTTTTVIFDGEVVIDSTQNLTNLVKNESFSAGLDENWVYNSTSYILSQWNASGGNAELNFTVPVVPEMKIASMEPNGSSADGIVFYEMYPPGSEYYGREDVNAVAHVGEAVVPGFTDRDQRAFFYFDIGSIPDLATVLNVAFYTYITFLSSSPNHEVDFHALDYLPSQSDQDLFNDTSDGNLYIDNDQSLSSSAATGYREWNLGALGIADVQNNLTTNNWFGIGIEEEGDDDWYGDIATFDHDTWDAYLNVTYLDPNTTVTFNETAYVNQTFTKNRGTPDVSHAANLTFDYTIDNFGNLNDTWLVAKIDGTKVWEHEVTGTEPKTSVGIDVGNYMVAAKDYVISLQLHANESSGNNMTCLARFDNVNITVKNFIMDGTYTSRNYNAGGTVLWGNITWNASVPPETVFTIRTSTSPDGSAWSSWSDEYTNPLGEAITSPANRYIKYTVNLSTTNQSQTPVLNDVTITFHSFRPSGTIEMSDDLTVPNLIGWGIFNKSDSLTGGTIEYWYSTDGSGIWTPMPSDGNLSGASISSKAIRFRAVLTAGSPITTPTMFFWNLTYYIGDVSTLTGGVDPGFGYVNQWFNFTVNYTDPDDEAPVGNIVYLNITGGPSHQGSWVMGEVDSNDDNYTDGKWYYCNYTGFTRGNNYTYHFAAQDPTGSWGTSSSKDGPYVLNSPPRITTNNDQGAEEAQLYYVDYEASDLENDILTWFLNTNCTWLGFDVGTGVLQGTPPGGDKGYYWVNISVKDGNGGSDWTNFSLVVGDTIPPVADAGYDDWIYEDDMYQFNGTNSSDNSGVLNYTWYFGDGTIGHDPRPTHVYARNGTYDVFLVVRDPLDNEDWAHIQITVVNLPPVAEAGPDQTISEGETAYFYGGNSYDTPTDNATLIYIWDLDGDGNYDVFGTSPAFTYLRDGPVAVGLMVLDNDGAFNIDTLVVTVLNVAPTADIGDFYDGEVGTDITLVALGSDPGDDILVYRWDFENDGQWDTGYSTGSMITKKWSNVGNYTVRCQVSDGADSGEDTAFVDVSRRKQPPTIGDLGIVKIRFSDPYTIDLSTFISDEDTPLTDLEVRTTDPANISIDGLKIHLFYPAEARGETVFVDVYVSDGDAEANSTLGIIITANFPPTLDSLIPDVVFFEDEESLNAFNLNNYFSDRDGEALTFRFNYTNPNLMVQEKSGWVTFKPSPNWAGTTLVIIRAEDPNGAYKEDAILVTVTPVNDPPIVLKEIPKGFRTINENENWTIDLYDYFLDVDTPYLTFECNNPAIIIDQFNHTATWVPRGKETLSGVVFSASDGEYSVSLEPIDLKMRTSEPFPWILMILPFILGLAVFAVYRELRYRYNIEEVFLVDNAGVLLVHLSRGESKAIDAKLVSGMLTAVQEFVRDSFRSDHERDDAKTVEGALGKLEYGDFKIVIERGQYTFLSAVISGYDNKRLRGRMKDVVDDFEKEYSFVLADWDGDMARFEGAEKIVGKLLKTGAENSMLSAEEKMPGDEMAVEYVDDGIFEDELPAGDFADMPPEYEETGEEQGAPPEDQEEPPPPPPPPPPD